MAARRLAMGWTQARVAEEWNKRWPDEPKSARNISLWENNDSPGGFPPTRLVRQRLAELYQCEPHELGLE